MEELRYEIDLLKAMNERIQAEQRMYQLVCDLSSDAYIYVDLVRGIVKSFGSWNSFFEGIEIHNLNELSKLYSVVEDHSVLLLRELIYLEQSSKDSSFGEFKLINTNKFFSCTANIIRDNEGRATDKILKFTDITKNKSQNDELLYLAYYDSLTGLFNRNYFVKMLSDFIRNAEEENSIVTVMFFDLDDFHNMNDGMGMVIGDEIVQQFGFILNEFKSDRVIISHFNTDIFCLAIYDADERINPDMIYRYLVDKLKEPIRLSNGNEIFLSFGVGVSEYPETAVNSLELINCAEIVMLKAKKKGRNCIQYFDAPILNEFINSVSIENKLKSAVFEQNFLMNFQPQYFTSDCSLRGVEALIRWRDDDGHMIPPSTFIPIAEKNGTIIPMGDFVLDSSIRKFSSWRSKYSYPFILSINISAIQFRTENFVSNLLDIISRYDVNPEEIELEITESIFIEDFRDICEKLVILREYGIKISLDDFGTGYSSLGYLKGLPIDTLKIDKSFIDTINTDENSRIIIESIIFLSKKLGYETVAEGVETDDQFESIKEMGCDCIQGYYLSKPVDSKGIESILGGI